jgi:hypothetical protein
MIPSSKYQTQRVTGSVNTPSESCCKQASNLKALTSGPVLSQHSRLQGGPITTSYIDDMRITEQCEEAEATTINECNDRDDWLTTENPSRKMPIVNHVTAIKNMNNSKLTNESRIRESTQADYSSMQRAGVKN